MRTIKKMYETVKPGAFSQVLSAYKGSAPNLITGALSGDLWRHKSVGRTLQQISNPDALKALETQADKNMEEWSKAKSPPPFVVDVVPKDWGVATLDATRRYGKIYSVLNMASSKFPGGSFLQGGSAQEEGLWHRTTCPTSLLSNGVLFDSKKNWFVYDPATEALVLAKTKMSAEELSALRKKRKMDIPEAYKVFFNEQQQVCFRGPEVLVPTSTEDVGFSSRLVADSHLSYLPLSMSRVFPFYELRSAAPELAHLKINWEDESFLEEYRKVLRQSIGAQLDTLIVQGKTNVALSAWGCGEFRNKPEIVARIYKEEIEKRALHFQHLMFPIIDYGRTNNFQVFQEELSGLKLGPTTPLVFSRALSHYGFHTPQPQKPAETQNQNQVSQPLNGSKPV
ncbi:poly(ADP-ribose) glycohydrolase domain-containing protein [Legionella waltersii]|uniref:Microbial-type PARG catalytic domain-containing protein n=1 Tax=Legionella waltersii TaxID=66969 RepID=A0A0W1ANN6_9GAMM|nr:poly(ADP-ribose) glycohydrolase domain-containing protein [Legionella waltersii]KTD82940.1 hypothetical protein Lwal_0418 [Legionella waltersii]SNV02441.1 Uncharacterized protein conserved in bacteria [Legionella waltersii]